MTQKEAFLEIQSFEEYQKRRKEFEGLDMDSEVREHIEALFPRTSNTTEEVFRDPLNRGWK